LQKSSILNNAMFGEQKTSTQMVAGAASGAARYGTAGPMNLVNA